MLTKTNLPELQNIMLRTLRNYTVNCNINNCGANHLSKAMWPSLTKLYLSNFNPIKSQIKLVPMDMNPLLNVICRGYQRLQ
jgi:hypothetical protein